MSKRLGQYPAVGQIIKSISTCENPAKSNLQTIHASSKQAPQAESRVQVLQAAFLAHLGTCTSPPTCVPIKHHPSSHKPSGGKDNSLRGASVRRVAKVATFPAWRITLPATASMRQHVPACASMCQHVPACSQHVASMLLMAPEDFSKSLQKRRKAPSLDSPPRPQPALAAPDRSCLRSCLCRKWSEPKCGYLFAYHCPLSTHRQSRRRKDWKCTL